MKNLFKKFKNLFKKRSKKNELEIFEKFRIVPKKEERERIEAITKGYKDGKIKGTAYLIGLAIVTPFTGEGKKFYTKTPGDLITVFKSSIRDVAISQVSFNIRKKNKKANQYNNKNLEQQILQEESRIKKKGRLRLLKTVILAQLGIGVLPFL
mgnify:FL=1|tara:strand:- start:50 stop:508 length:459 start_codon:yes stop_codon:yes gene_type:complete